MALTNKDALICPICGSNEILEYSGKLKCRFCDTIFNEPKDEDAVRLIAYKTADKYLQMVPPKFDIAQELFRDMIREYPDWSVPYWGYIRATYGIKYEKDELEDKIVPICYDGEYRDFTADEYFLKAIEVEKDLIIKTKYMNEALRIKEAYEKFVEASKNEEYDVFLSFKARELLSSDETKDKKVVEKLYKYLSDKGLKVFFSPITMVKHLGSSYYDVYIYNAINKAKAMILYGSNIKYFESTWIRNEWSRYLFLLKEGRKDEDSFIIVTDNVDESKFPRSFGRRQSIDVNAYPKWMDIVYERLEDILELKKEEPAPEVKEEPKHEEKKEPSESKKKEQPKETKKEPSKPKGLKELNGKEFKCPACGHNEYIMKDGFVHCLECDAPFEANGDKLIAIKCPSCGSQRFDKKDGHYHCLDCGNEYGEIVEKKTKTAAKPEQNNKKSVFTVLGKTITKYTGNDENIIIPEGIERIGASVFYKNDTIKSVTMPDSVVSLGSKAFSECNQLSKVVLSKKLKEIGSNVFMKCPALKEIEIPDSITTISRNAFYNCASLESVKLGSGLKNIESHAFWGCPSLKNIKFPNSLELIDEYAFYSCTSLTIIQIPKGVTKIGKYAFYKCNLTSVVVDSPNIISFGDWLESSKKSIVKYSNKEETKPKIPPTSSKKTTVNGFEIENGELIKYHGSKNDVVIPDSVRSIVKGAFMDTKMVSLTIPFIGSGLPEDKKPYFSFIFGASSRSTTNYVPTTLKNVIIKEGIKTIPDSAFYFLKCIERITIPNSVETIAKCAFVSCGFKSIIIPDGVKDIQSCAFQLCNDLSSIVLPWSLKHIGYAAFSGINKHNKIFYKGSKEDWKKIKIDGSNHGMNVYYFSSYYRKELLTKYWHFNKNGEPEAW